MSQYPIVLRGASLSKDIKKEIDRLRSDGSIFKVGISFLGASTELIFKFFEVVLHEAAFALGIYRKDIMLATWHPTTERRKERMESRGVV